MATIFKQMDALQPKSQKQHADGPMRAHNPGRDWFWIQAESGFGPNPVRVRVTAEGGQVLEDDLPTVQGMLVVDGKARFQ